MLGDKIGGNGGEENASNPPVTDIIYCTYLGEQFIYVRAAAEAGEISLISFPDISPPCCTDICRLYHTFDYSYTKTEQGSTLAMLSTVDETHDSSLTTTRDRVTKAMCIASLNKDQYFTMPGGGTLKK